MGYMNYKYSTDPGGEYDLSSQYSGKGSPQMSMEVPSGSGMEGSLAAAGAMKANPYLLGASFLLSYLKSKQDEFKRKQDMEMQNVANYQNDQEQALNSLNQSWKSALLR